MAERSESPHKTPRRPAVTHEDWVPHSSKSGSYLIVKPTKATKKTSLMRELARHGVYLAVSKGLSKSAINKRLNAALGVTKAARNTDPQPRARLVGAGIRHFGTAKDFTWASPDDLDAALNMSETLSSDEIAARLGKSRETIKQWRAGGRVLGVEGAKRRVRYPVAQLSKNFSTLPGLQQVIEALDGDHWEAWRFLANEIDELDGTIGFDALREGRLQEVLDILDARAQGSFT